MQSAERARQPGFLVFPFHAGSEYREAVLSHMLRRHGNPICFSEGYGFSLPLADAWRDDRFCSIMLIGAHDLWAPMARSPFMGFRLSLDYDGDVLLPRAVIARKGLVPTLAMSYLLKSNIDPEGRCRLDDALAATKAVFATFYSISLGDVAEPESPSVFRQ